MFTALILKRAAVRQTTASLTDASWQLTDEQWLLIADLLITFPFLPRRTAVDQCPSLP